MRKIFSILAFVSILSNALYSRSYIMSSIPLPESYFINIKTANCDEECMEDYLKSSQYFSFLAAYSPEFSDESIQKAHYTLASMFNLPSNFIYNPVLDISDDSSYVKLAVLLPQKKIKRYSMTVVNSILGYLFSQNSSFDIEVFDCGDEDPEVMQYTLDKIKSRGYKVIIAPVTPTGARFLAYNTNDMLIFIPTINSSLIPDASSNVLFGGIDYKKQIDTLSSFANENIALFSDGSTLSVRLDSFVMDDFPDILYQKELSSSRLNLKDILKDNETLKDATIFLNMPLVKSSLLASQLRAYEIEPYSLLSTQINYHPMLLTLTQYKDRQSLYLANSIDKSPLVIKATNSLFGHSIVYDWVNYSTNVGLDYLFSNYFNREHERMFSEDVDTNQIIYNVNILKPSAHGFYQISR